MRIRTFFITYLVPCILFLMVAQLSFGVMTNYRYREEGMGSLNLMVMLDNGVKEDSVNVISSKVQKITGRDVKVITPTEELERFKSKFGVDVMTILSENPFGYTLSSSISYADDPVVVKSAINKIKGVHSIAYPDQKRAEITTSFDDIQSKYSIFVAILVIAVIFSSWISEHFEVVANQQVIADKRASKMPISRIRKLFLQRAFVKGTMIGFMASILFIGLRMAISMNKQIDVTINLDKCLIISAFVIISSLLLTLLMQTIAFDVDAKK